MSVVYFDQLLLAPRKVHAVYFDQLLGAAHYLHFISNHNRKSEELDRGGNPKLTGFNLLCMGF